MPSYPHLAGGLSTGTTSALAYGPFQGAIEDPAGARPSKCIIIIFVFYYLRQLYDLGGTEQRKAQVVIIRITFTW
jgi:hypothetical protein